MMRRKLLLALALTSVLGYGQTVYNLNNQDLDFGGAGVTITPQVGTGKAVGDVVLYENVVSIGTQQIDAIIRTVSLTGTMTYHDNPSTSGSGMSNNQARFFSPQFNFATGGGSCMFRFEFIEGGTYNTSTDSGTIVALTEVLANTYDIDGNGGSGSNQYNEFGGFDTVYLGNPTNVTPTFNFSTYLTKFRSNSNVNVTNVLDDRTRVLVGFPVLSSFDIVVGAEGRGAAYFFIDFGSGATWSTSPNVFYPPELDLDTLTSGTGNLDTFCNSPTYFSEGGTNIIANNGDLAALRIQFTTAEIMDGANEKLIIGGATSGDSIALNFAHGAMIPNITFGGNTYTVTAEVVGNESALIIQASGGGSILEADAEEFIDSMMYYNSIGTSGERIFDVYLIDDAFASIQGSYTANVNCGILPVTLIDFDVKLLEDRTVSILWSSSQEFNSSHFEVERSQNLTNWEIIDQISAQGYSNELVEYRSSDLNPLSGTSYYRLALVDHSAERTTYEAQSIELNTLDYPFQITVVPSLNLAKVQGDEASLDQLTICTLLGQDLTSDPLILRTSKNTLEVPLNELPRGILIFKTEKSSEMIHNF